MIEDGHILRNIVLKIIYLIEICEVRVKANVLSVKSRMKDSHAK